MHVELESTKVKVPVGKGVDSGVKNSHLLYNEYITYTTEQVRMRYVFVMVRTPPATSHVGHALIFS